MTFALEYLLPQFLAVVVAILGGLYLYSTDVIASVAFGIKCNSLQNPNAEFLNINKGTPVIIPVMELHSDPEIYQEPDKFDPERFSEENIARRHQYVYLPFGEGTRNCIGMRFGLLQTKFGLISLLSKYRFSPGPNIKIPLDFENGHFLLNPRGAVALRIENR